jgi:DNA-directed RNA polymerase subunit RPC12/RpoP
LLEVIDSLNIIPSIDGINKPYEYVQKMSGWINRLNEIRSRLKCTSCGKALISNKKYAKNLAAYNSTIFFCDCGDKLNSSVYISHCWACRKIIDSREGNIQIDKYYLCIQCSSGPLKSESYSQGTVCPKCGSKQLVKIRNRNYECSICDHHIHLPALQCLTGNRIREKEYEY